eukprot:TRINITY_DN74081_c0_g1_i1.p1 TRINITY_DN74081_c0_g1~~TRINITY_DN74081_c0_g1_i1.p1  ORF type:complete len:329 (+),score=42.19 TRINITY_DN74081_c0_g1_i1:135-1121(+)
MRSLTSVKIWEFGIDANATAGHERDSMLWLLGVGLAVCGTLVGTVGKQLVRYSALCQQDGREQKGAILLVLGLVMQVVLNPAFDLAGYALAPASVIAPVLGMEVVWNTALAQYFLKETLTTSRLHSSAVILVTVPASVLFRQIPKVAWTSQYVMQVIVQSRTLAYAICFGAWYLLNVFVLMRYEKGSPIRGFSIGATAGSLAGNMWCAKITAALASTCLSGNCEAWHHWISWATLFGAILFATSNTYYITRGLQEYESLFMVTIYMAALVATNCLSAIVVLAEMDDAPWWKVTGYTSCILGMIVGMTLSTKGEGKLAKDVSDAFGEAK